MTCCRSLVTLVAVCMIGLSVGPTAARAQARTCGDLWYRRNAEYKAAGYCFHTPQAIQAFGNAGCQFDDMNAVPLSSVQHQIVAEIIEQERQMGCH